MGAMGIMGAMGALRCRSSVRDMGVVGAMGALRCRASVGYRLSEGYGSYGGSEGFRG